MTEERQILCQYALNDIKDLKRAAVNIYRAVIPGCGGIGLMVTAVVCGADVQPVDMFN